MRILWVTRRKMWSLQSYKLERFMNGDSLDANDFEVLSSLLLKPEDNLP